MKTIALLAFVAAASAAPQNRRFLNQFDEFGNPIQRVQTFREVVRPFIPIIAESRSEPEGGNYAFSFQTDNGILRSEEGTPGFNGATNQRGSWTVTHPNGDTYEVRFE